MTAIFGAAGNGDLFYSQGFKSSEQMPQWLYDFGLDAYEYQCGNGVRIKEETANKIKKAADGKIVMSLHTPYYINLATPDEEKKQKSINYIIQSAQAAEWIGAERIVVHSGALGKMTRSEALEFAKNTLMMAQKELDNAGYRVVLCIETMGKINQLGNLDEVMELCSLDERFLPTIDFGHLNARTLGGIKTQNDYKQILDTIENKLGYDRLKIFHSHFSKIEYTKGGEKKHLTFEDDIFGPDFEPLAEIIAKKNLLPHIICESAGTQPEDALKMKKIYTEFRKEQ